MSFLKDNISTVEFAEGVMAFLPPSPAEVRRCDEISAFLKLEENRDPRMLLPELFLLKVGLGAEYGMGLLQQLGMNEAGVLQFFELYTQQLSAGFAAFFKSSAAASVTIMRDRIRAYGDALHQPHPEDPHLALADCFSRYVGAPDDPELVSLCLDTCRAMHGRFMDEIKSLSKPEGA